MFLYYVLQNLSANAECLSEVYYHTPLQGPEIRRTGVVPASHVRAYAGFLPVIDCRKSRNTVLQCPLIAQG